MHDVRIGRGWEELVLIAVRLRGRTPGVRLMTSESLWRDPDFVRYWASRAVSMLGSAITYVALPVLVYRLTGSATWTGLRSAASTPSRTALRPSKRCSPIVRCS